MYIKVNNENIVGHDYYQYDDFNIEVPDQVLYDTQLRLYKFKYVNNQLVEIPYNELQQLKVSRDSQLQIEAEKQAKIATGKAAREVCQKVLDFVAGDNLDKSLTMEQITEMQTLFSQAENALRAGRPSLAKLAIMAIEPDGVLVSQSLKDACLELLVDY